MGGLFRKNIEKNCTYCAHGCLINDREVVCAKKGITDVTSNCRRFSYDPLKRIPPRSSDVSLQTHSAEEFQL